MRLRDESFVEKVINAGSVLRRSTTRLAISKEKRI